MEEYTLSKIEYALQRITSDIKRIESDLGYLSSLHGLQNLEMEQKCNAAVEALCDVETKVQSLLELPDPKPEDNVEDMLEDNQ